jgi:hypothetical protein
MIIFAVVFIVSFLGLFIIFLRNKESLFLKIWTHTSSISLVISCVIVHFWVDDMLSAVFIRDVGLLLVAGYIYSALEKNRIFIYGY